MTIEEMLKNSPMDSFRLNKKRNDIYQLIAPIFHEDGDMMSIYLEKENESHIRISDHGMSLMRLDYLFDIDSDRKRSILDDIILSRGATLNQGSIELSVDCEELFAGIMTFSQLVSEVCNMDILTRETIANMFYDYLDKSIENIGKVKDIPFIKDYTIKGYPDICIDYAFLNKADKRPVFLFGVKDTNKAQQTAINCLQMTINDIPHKSICVFENIDNITKFSRNSLLNATHKVFSDLDTFNKSGADFIVKELAS